MPEVYVRPLLLAETHTLPSPPPVARPVVTVLPFLAERRSGEAPSRSRAGPPVAEVVRRLRLALPSTEIRVPVRDDRKLWGSCLRAFWAEALPWLPSPPRRAVVVTHGNVLRGLLRAAGFRAAAVPNGAVVEVRIRDGADGNGDRDIFFVRHCLTRHNVTRRGCPRMTACISGRHVEAARGFFSVAGRCAGVGAGLEYFSSSMPRAIASAAALQAPLDESVLLRLAEVSGEPRALRFPLSNRRQDDAWAAVGCGEFCGDARVARTLSREALV